MGRGGACVPARVAPQGRIRRSFPVHDACIFGMETPLRGRSGGHTGTAPTISFGQIARCISAPSVLFGGVGVYYFNNTGFVAFLLSNSNVGGGYFFRRTSRPSYLQMASIHSSGMGMEWFSSRS